MARYSFGKKIVGGSGQVDGLLLLRYLLNARLVERKNLHIDAGLVHGPNADLAQFIQAGNPCRVDERTVSRAEFGGNLIPQEVLFDGYQPRRMILDMVSFTPAPDEPSARGTA